MAAQGSGLVPPQAAAAISRRWYNVCKIVLTTSVCVNVLLGVTTWIFFNKWQVTSGVAKAAFFEFCYKRQPFLKQDKDAQTFCGMVWEQTLKASADAGVIVTPYRTMQIMTVESLGDERAISVAGAWGKMQIHIGYWRFDQGGARTWVTVHGRYPYGCDVLEPACNVYTGVRIYAEELKRFKDEHLALLAYNRGGHNVQRDLREGRDPSNGYSKRVQNI